MAGDFDQLVALEVQALATYAGMLLVFFPFFANRYSGRKMGSRRMLRWLQRSLWLVPLSALVPTTGATLGLLVLLGHRSLTDITHVMTFVSVWMVVVLAAAVAWLEART